MIKEIIDDFGNRSPLSSIVTFSTIVRAFEIVIGSYLSQNVIIKGFENGMILLHSESSSVRSEILLRKAKIIDSINRELNVEKIKGISFI